MADDSDVQEITPPAKPSGAGRPRSDIHRFFADGPFNSSCRRHDQKCQRCSKTIPAGSAKLHVLKKHVVQACPGITAEERLEVMREDAAAVVSTVEGSSTSAARSGSKRPKPSSSSDIRAHFASSLTALAPSQRQTVAEHLLRWLVTSNIPFRAVASSHLQDALAVLRPGYAPPSPATFATTLLQREVHRIMVDQHDELQKAEYLTLAVDGWTDFCRRSLYACVVLLPDRSMRLLHVQDMSSDSHTAEHVAEYIKKVAHDFKITKLVTLLVTDDAANLHKARELVVASDGFNHMLQIRCYMHAFALVMTSAIAFSWARLHILAAQRIVTFFRASHAPLAELRNAANQLGIKRGLQSANKTRMTSVELCLSSLVDNSAAFTILLQTKEGIITNQAVLATLRKPDFFPNVTLLRRVLQPFSQVIMAVQSSDTTLADISRGAALAGAAGSSSSSSARGALWKKAADVAASRGYGADDIKAVLKQLMHYATSSPPFDLPFLDDMDCTTWWRNMRAQGQGELADLALPLLSVVPHAAGPEEVFSRMGWFHSGQRARLSSATNTMLTTIKLYYEGAARRNQAARAKAARVEADGVDVTAPPQLPEGVADAVDSIIAAARADLPGDDDLSLEELDALLESWIKESERDQHQEQQQQEQQQAGGAGSADAPEGFSSWTAAVADAIGEWDLSGPDLMDPQYSEAALQQAAREVTTPTVVDTSAIVAEQLAQMQQGLLAAAVARQHTAFAPPLAAAAQAQALQWMANLGGQPPPPPPPQQQ